MFYVVILNSLSRGLLLFSLNAKTVAAILHLLEVYHLLSGVKLKVKVG